MEASGLMAEMAASHGFAGGSLVGGLSSLGERQMQASSPPTHTLATRGPMEDRLSSGPNTVALG